jgi:hypothetical protein
MMDIEFGQWTKLLKLELPSPHSLGCLVLIFVFRKASDTADKSNNNMLHASPHL